MGEGSFTGSLDAPALAVALHASDPQPLLQLRAVFGGRIYGPYTYGIRQKRVWLLRGWQLGEAVPYIEEWLPPSRKPEQVERWKVKWATYFERQVHRKVPTQNVKR